MRVFSLNRLVLFMMLSVLGASMAIAQDKTISVEINKGQMVRLDRPASSVVVADPTTADVQVVSPKLIFVHGKKVGETTVYAVDGADESIMSATVRVSHNISSLNRALKRAAPDADVEAKTVDGGLVLDGFTSSVEEADNIKNIASSFLGENDKMINMMTSAGSDQVMLQVRVVEMNRTNVKRFGVNLQAAFNQGDLMLRMLQGRNITPLSTSIPPIVAPPSGLPFPARANSDSAVFGGITDGNKSIGALVDALENQGLANILAEPTLTTTSGKAANFLAGGEFPIPVKDGLGNISVTYKPFGVKLDFTPVVMSKDRMSITVAPEVSTINFDNPIEVSGLRNPIINTRKAQATIEMGSGDTFMLAGLLRNDESNSIDKFPGIGDMPILGSLFRSQAFRNDKTELVILVTPYLVRPVAEREKMLTPRDGYTPPNDFQRLLMGNLYQQEPMEGWGRDMPKLSGQGGFILEEQP